jgi:type IV secretion system protein VirB8
MNAPQTPPGLTGRSAAVAEALQTNRGWERDMVWLTRRSERRAWRVAASGVAIGLLGVATAFTGGAMRQIVPLPIVVDKTTGETTIVQRLAEETVPAMEAVDKFNATRYVRARERYYWQFLNDDMRQVARTTTPPAFADYQKRFAKGNSLADQLKRTTEWRIEVIGVRFTAATKFGSKGEAIVTYDKEEYIADRDAVTTKTRNVATFLYEYQPKVKLGEADRMENPLGFLVTAYRTDPELGPK